MTDFNLLRAESDGQLFIHVHTERTTFIVALEDRELTDLRDTVAQTPDRVDR